jgi:hypothetical protein
MSASCPGRRRRRGRKVFLVVFYRETSAESGEGVDEIFTKTAEMDPEQENALDSPGMNPQGGEKNCSPRFLSSALQGGLPIASLLLAFCSSNSRLAPAGVTSLRVSEFPQLFAEFCQPQFNHDTEQCLWRIHACGVGVA